MRIFFLSFALSTHPSRSMETEHTNNREKKSNKITSIRNSIIHEKSAHVSQQLLFLCVYVSIDNFL